jgi:RNA polymerase sigma-70 factor (ECF subfamily)
MVTEDKITADTSRSMPALEDKPGAQNEQWISCLEKVASDQDLAAFRMLFNHFSPLIKSFAFKVPSLQESESFGEELVQETMFKVWSKASTFDPSLASPGTWIFTIARNMRIDLLRKQARHAVNTVSLHQADDSDDDLDMEDIWLEDDTADLFNQLVQMRSRKQIHESLKTLPKEQAEILRKVYLEDKSHAEVAHELSLPLGTVKSRVRLALSKLKLIVDR